MRNIKSVDSMRRNWISVVCTLLSIIAFSITRFVRLEDFPIYFFCDEAFIGIEARRLIANNFFSADGEFLPMYWNKAEGRWVPQISIYLSIIPTLLFPTKIWALRMVTGIVSLVGILIGSWGLQKAIKERGLVWLPLALSTIMPVLLLHNRLAFETSNAIAGIFAALGFYLVYRLENPKYLTGFLVSVLFTFYSHWSGSIVISAVSVALLLIDAPYHLATIRKFPRFVALQVVVVLLGAAPFFRFLYIHPLGIFQQLSILGSGITRGEPLSETLNSGFRRFLDAFDSEYWFRYTFLPDQIRHIWKDRPFLTTVSQIPFFVGLVVTLCTFWTVRSRVLLVSFVCGALPVVMTETHVQRMFYMVAPAILIMVVGVAFCYRYCRGPVAKTVLQLLLFTVISFESAALTKEFLGAGLWYHSYTLGGLQWGAKALFADAIPKVLSEYPEATITASGEWANGADLFPVFFLNSEQRTRIRAMPFDLFYPEPDQVIPPDRIFILSPPERLRINDSGKFKPIEPILEIPYPDGTLGFTFSHLVYVDTIEELMAPERMARRVPQEASLVIWGTKANLIFSRLDIGSIAEIFDHNIFTIARGMLANPFKIDISFEEPRIGLGLNLDLFPMDVGVKVLVQDVHGKIVGEGSAEVKMPGPDKDTSVTLRFAEGPVSFSKMALEVRSLGDLPDRAHVHIRELTLLSQPEDIP